jgi:GTP pyrophosphokinase
MDRLLEQVKQIDTVEDAQSLLFSLTKEIPNIEKAVDFATRWHEGQFRKSGQPYIVHPILVAAIVSHFGGDQDMVFAALLHDVVEDTSCSSETIAKEFSPEIAHLVDGLTKIVEIREEELVPSTSNEKLVTSALSFRKMLLASITDVRVLVVKLCDRLHNMLTLDALSEAKQKRISEETLVVYAPIAHRLGIATIKNALEDLSFYYLLPEEYAKIDTTILGKDQKLQLSLNHFIDKVTRLMLQNGFTDKSFKIEKRIKHHYSIYMKMHRKGISMEEILDLMAIRILVKEPNDCYRVLGIIHQNFNPLISRFKDYIAIPKDNGYQTIHTTVFADSSIIETQIRTFDMHKTAQFGIAAHWKYKGHTGLNPKLKWLNELTMQSEAHNDIEEMYELAKDDLYSEDISVFSPKGDLYTLPRCATVLDFAYAVHTEIGNCAKVAYVNKLKTPFLTELKNGDIVRIETAKEHVLRCTWINAVKTAKAKNAMKINCNHKLKELNTLSAENIIANTFNLKYSQLQPFIEDESTKKNLYKSAIDPIHLQEDIVKIKKKILNSTKIIPIISPIRKYKLKQQKFDNIIFYTTQSISKVLFDYCCHPKSGDEIVAFKKGSNAVIHHKFCSHAYELMLQRKPMLYVEWSRQKPNSYKLIVSIENKKGSLAYFLQYLAKIDVNLVTIKLSENENSHAHFFEMVVDVPSKSREQLLNKSNEKYKIIDFIPLDDAYKKI